MLAGLVRVFMSYEINEMTEPITKLDDAFVTFHEYATGKFYLRFKEGVTRDTPMSPRLESMKLLIREDYPNIK